MMGQAAGPMRNHICAWAVYDVVDVRGDEQIFLAVVIDSQWAKFYRAFNLQGLLADARRATNNERVHARYWMLPLLRRPMMRHIAAALALTFQENGLPFADITKPEDLFDNPHLLTSGVLAFMTLPDSKFTQTPLLPITLDRERPGFHLDSPNLGEHMGYPFSSLRQRLRFLILGLMLN